MKHQGIGLAMALSVGLAAMTVPARADSLNYYDTMSGANFVKWWQTYAVPACQGDVGSDVAYTSAGSPEVLQRIKAAGDGAGDIDILFLAPDKIAAFHDAGVLADLRKLDIPNLANTEAPENEKAAGTPLDGTGAPFFRYTYTLIYNGDQVKDPPKTWKELYERRDEWKGHISYVDPRSTVSGAGRFFVAMFLRAFGSDLGFDNGKEDATWAPAWEKLADFEKANAPKHAESGGAHAAQLLTGEIWIGFHALDFALYSAKTGTMPPSTKTVLMEDGVPGGAGYLAIPNNISPEKKAAAAKFINCALSEKVQVAMSTEMLEFPGTNVWDKLKGIPGMPSKESFVKSRAADPSAEALKHISAVWADKVGY